MIFLSPECFPCFLRQADLAARAHGAPEGRRIDLAARVSRRLAALPPKEIPARIATHLQAEVREVLGTDDPYALLKEREFERFVPMARLAGSAAAGSPDRLAAALWVSAYGNIMDAGIVAPGEMEEEIRRLAAGNGAPMVPARLRAKIAAAARIGVLLDNAGEAAFDVPLLSLLAASGKDVWIGVKGGPVIDDLTEREARRIGLGSYGEIVSNGNRGVGTDLDMCAPAFRARIDSSDLVIVKGQANFETLVGRLRRAFFLLRCKCPVVARALGAAEGELVFRDGEAA